MSKRSTARYTLRNVRFLSPILGQLILGLLSAVILSGEQFGRIVGLGSLAHWLVTVMILVRRNSALTRTDLAILHYGYILFMVLVVAVDFVAAAASGDL